MFKALLISSAAIILMGCNNPKSTPLPEDLAKLGEDKKFTEQAKKLNEDDKKLLAGYLMRAVLAQSFGQKSTEHLTIGEAINNQQAWLKEREIKEKEENELRQVEIQKLEAQKATLNDAFKITFIKRGELTKMNYSDVLPIYLHFKNSSNKQINGLKATIVFTDQFGQEFKRLSIEESTTIPSDLDKTVEYQWDYNKFDDEMVKLHTLEDGKFKVDAHPTHIVFADGTELKID